MNLYDADLEWFLNCSDSVLGERGVLSSTISALERGGESTGTFEEPFGNVPLYDWHRSIERERRCRARWRKLDRATQAILVAHYSTAPLKVPHMAARFGDLAGVILFLANGRDLMSADRAYIRKLETEARALAKEAHQTWRSTRDDDKKEKAEPRWKMAFNA